MDWLDSWFSGEEEDPEGDDEPYLPELGSFATPSIDPAFVLSEGSPRQVLARLVDGDPLELSEAAERLLWATPYFLDPVRVRDRLFARVAYDARLFVATKPLETFVRRCFRQSTRDLCEEQMGEELARAPVTRSLDREYYREVADVCRLSPEKARRLCCTLNAQGEGVRFSFHRAALYRIPLREIAEEIDRPLEVVQGDIRTALLAIAQSIGEDASQGLRDSIE